MSAKENPGHRAEGFSQSSFAATQGESTVQPPRSSNNRNHLREIYQIAVTQLDLFIEDDRPERGCAWIINPSAPATKEELDAFFMEVSEFLASEEGEQ
jgi:peptide methionine sulfoxide reductase MsrB